MKKIAVFGTGHLGTIHAKCIHQIPSATLIGIYDIDRAKAESVAAELHTVAYPSPEELLNDCDIADIVTTTSEHYEVAKMAVLKKKHIFIEKPVCADLQDAEELIRLAGETGVYAQVGHVERFNPAFMAAQPFIDTPMFIESHRLALFNQRGNDVSVVLDLMIHDIDIILKIVNRDVKDIQASGVPIVTDTFDIANVRLTFEGGCVANLTASRLSLKNMRKIRIFQPNAYISVDLLDKKTEIIQLNEISEEKEDPFALILDLGNEKGKKQIVIRQPEITPINAIQTEIESFIYSIEHEEAPIVTLEDGYRALKIAYQILEKMNEPVK